MRILSTVLFTASLLVFGCSSGGDTTGAGPGTTASASYTQKVGAAGGTFTAPGATVVIPAGALAADTTLTLTVSDKAGQPNADTIAASIFDFGPNGTTFLKPVTMTLDFTGTAPSGAVAKIAFLEAGAWVPLADSAPSGGKVTATTTHFTPFTVVWGPGGQISGGCTAFTPCGGDVVAKWTYTAGCLDLPAGTNPYAKTCPTATMTATADVTGNVEFKTDGTWAQTGMATTTLVVTLPKSCLGGVCQSGFVDAGANCTQTQAQAPASTNSSGTYSVAGNQLTLTQSAGGGPDAGVVDSVSDYCITGNSMQLLFTNPNNGTKVGYTLTK